MRLAYKGSQGKFHKTSSTRVCECTARPGRARREILSSKCLRRFDTSTRTNLHLALVAKSTLSPRRTRSDVPKELFALLVSPTHLQTGDPRPGGESEKISSETTPLTSLTAILHERQVYTLGQQPVFLDLFHHHQCWMVIELCITIIVMNRAFC
jgi:hypothetical protein